MPDFRENPRHLCEQLAAYEMGLLDDAQRVGFESHLNACDECLGDLYAHAPVAAAMSSDPGIFRRAFRQTLTAKRPSQWSRISARWPGLGLGRLMVPLVAAAALAMVLLLPRGGADSPYRDLAVLEPLAYTRLEVRSGAGDSTALVFERGMDAYLAEDYAAAAAELAEVPGLLQRHPDARSGRQTGLAAQADLFRGVSLLLANDPAKAIPVLAAAAASPLLPVRERAQWNLVQAYLLTDQPIAAEEVLSKMLASPIYGERARALNQKLHDLP